ncbi:hypothetical protein B0T26DRAFT_714081, partial [Lasiosphaeria miniovina]
MYQRPYVPASLCTSVPMYQRPMYQRPYVHTFIYLGRRLRSTEVGYRASHVSQRAHVQIRPATQPPPSVLV